jgi:hypothetical protein
LELDISVLLIIGKKGQHSTNLILPHALLNTPNTLFESNCYLCSLFFHYL